MDPATHRDLLDAYGRLKSEAHDLRALGRSGQDAREAREVAARRLAEAQRDELFLRHAVEELDALDPRSGEEAELAEKRNRLMHRVKLIEAVNVALAEIDGAAEPALGRALRALERIAPTAGQSDEGRVGKECVSTCRSRWSPYPSKTTTIRQPTNFHHPSTY